MLVFKMVVRMSNCYRLSMCDKKWKKKCVRGGVCGCLHRRDYLASQFLQMKDLSLIQPTQRRGPGLGVVRLQPSHLSSLSLLPRDPVPLSPGTLHAHVDTHKHTHTHEWDTRPARSSRRPPARLPRFTSRPGRMRAAAGSVAAISLRRSPLRFQQTGALCVFNRYHGHVEVTAVPWAPNHPDFPNWHERSLSP